MTQLKLAWVWARHQNRVFWRTPVAAFFTLALPLFMLGLFNSLWGNATYGATPEAEIKLSEYFVATIAAFTTASATYTNLGVMLTFTREEGTLKRIHSTPLSPWVYFSGVVGSATWIAFLGASMMFVLGIVAFGVDLPLGQLGYLLGFFVLGVAAFSALGFAVSLLARTGQSASAITNATILPLAFVSNIFIPLEEPPVWMEVVGRIFPLRAFAQLIRSMFDASIRGERWSDMLILLVWGVVGLIFVLKYFQWVPKAEQE